MIKRVNIKYIYYLFLYLLLVISLILFQLYPSLKFFILVPLILLLGLPIPFFLRKVFPIKNILSYLSLSLLLGLLFHSFIIFILGIAGIPITTTFLLLYLSISVIVNTLLYFFFIKEQQMTDYLENFKPGILDIIWLIFFFIIFLFFVQITTEWFFPNWDNFTYWAVDAKYIYQNHTLDGKSLDLLQKFYLPFYPLQLSFVYFLYGEIVEQYSALLTLLYAYSSLLFLYSNILGKRKTAVVKNLLYFLSFSGFFSFFLSLNTLVTQYAEVFCSVIILLFGVVTFSKSKTRKDFFLKSAMVLFLSTSLYFTKLAYAPISLLLIIIFFCYNFSSLRDIYKIIGKKGRIAFFIALIVILVIGTSFMNDSDFLYNILKYVKYVPESGIFTRERFLYFKDILKYLLNVIPEFILVSLILFSGFLFKSERKKGQASKKILVVLALCSLPLILYFFVMQDTYNSSLLRYMSLVFFLVPYLFIEISNYEERRNLVIELIVTIVFLLLSFSMIFEKAIEFGFNWDYLPNSGRYIDSDLIKVPYEISNKISEYIEKDSTIMFVSKTFYDQIGNVFPPSLYIRYFFLEESLGGQYSVPAQYWFGYLEKFNPEYVFVSDYSNFWPTCNSYLEEGGHYLIKIDEDIPANSLGECFFDSEDLTYIQI